MVVQEKPVLSLGIVAAGSYRPDLFRRLVGSLVALEFSGPFVVVDGSGTGAVWRCATETDGFAALRSALIEVDPARLGRHRHNQGAFTAISMGATYVTFPNDYHHVVSLPSQPEVDRWPVGNPCVGVGRLLGSGGDVISPPLFRSGKVNSGSSLLARRRAWGSALESSLLIEAGMFSNHGGWNERVATGRSDEIAASGDGLELVSRCIALGGCAFPVPGYLLGGGHRAPESSFQWEKFVRYGRGTIQMGRHLGQPEWYLLAHALRASLKGSGLIPIGDESVGGSRMEWQARARGNWMEWTSRWR